MESFVATEQCSVSEAWLYRNGHRGGSKRAAGSRKGSGRRVSPSGGVAAHVRLHRSHTADEAASLIIFGWPSGSTCRPFSFLGVLSGKGDFGLNSG